MMLKWVWAGLFVSAIAIVVASVLCLFEEEHTEKQLVHSPVDNALVMVEKPIPAYSPKFDFFKVAENTVRESFNKNLLKEIGR